MFLANIHIMSQEAKSFDVFVEKIVLHNRLVSKDRLHQVKAYISHNPEFSLLDLLLQSELLNQKHAELITSKFQTLSSQKKVKSSEQPHQAVPQQTGHKEDISTTVKNAEDTLSEDDESNNPLLNSTIEEEERPVQSEEGPIHHDSKNETKDDTESDNPLLDHTVQEEESPVKGLENDLAYAREQDASDLHISVDAPPMIRRYGKFHAFDRNPLTEEECEKLLFQILGSEQKQMLKKNQAIDFCMEIPEQGRYRTCIVRQRCGWDGSFRVIRSSMPTFEELGFSKTLNRLTEYQQGLVLVTGPSGMGKSTTLAAMVELINQTRHEHIITLEDPIEYIFTSKKSHISQREVGTHTQSYSAALRAALREDPDVIMVGELRDHETASLAITAAETGHLVFSTLHTTNAAQTIHRLLDMFPPKQQQQIRVMVSESIRGVVCQRLVPRADGKGRALALEVMFNIPAIGNLIREDRIYQIPNMMKVNQRSGMQCLEESIQTLLQDKVIDGTEAYHIVNDHLIFQKDTTQDQNAGT